MRRRESILEPLPEITAAELSYSMFLRYLNLNWRSEPLANPYAGSRSAKHRAASRLVKLVTHVLAPVLERDESFRAHIVRVENATAEAHDDLLREVRLLRAAIEERTLRMAEHIDSVAHRLDARLDALQDGTTAESSA